MTDQTFPNGFLWGTATAGHQIEGNNIHSNWWAWEQLGLVEDGSTSGQACDYWNRWREDHALMAELGFDVFRLGIEWSRIEPERDRFDDRAIDQYVEMLADLQARGIRVCLTLNHWVVPQWFAEGDSWLSVDALIRWRRFVERIVVAVAPHVDLWVTLNEPMVPVLAGYLGGYHPPEETNPRRAAKVFHRLLEAHAIAYEVIHRAVATAPDGSPTMVGYAAAYQCVHPWHHSGLFQIPERAVGAVVRRVSSGAWDKAVLTGRVPFPFGRGQTVPGLKGSIDWIGVNYYMRISVRLRPRSLLNVKSGQFDIPPGIEMSEMGWQIFPPGFREVVNDAWHRFGKPIYITENGCCDSGDDLRRRYLVTHLDQLGRAIGDGADVRGYMQWSFTDNFEWREGFEKRFGLIQVDHDDPDLVRRPRQSATLLSEVAAANALTDDIAEHHAPGSRTHWT